MVESNGLLNRRSGNNRYRGFKSLPLRQLAQRVATPKNFFTALGLALFTAMTVRAAGPSSPASPDVQQGWCTMAASRALADLRERPPADTNKLLSALIATGQALELADDTNEAASLYRQAADIARQQMRQPGQDQHSNARAYVEALIHLGAMEYTRCHYEQAGTLLRQAFELCRLTVPENDLLAKTVRNRFALVAGQQVPVEQRMVFYRTLRESCIKAFGKHHQETALVLDELTAIAMIRKDYKQASINAEEALQAWRKALGPGDPRVADAINRLASAYFERDQRKKLVPLLNEALKIRLEAFGPDHPKTALARENLNKARNAP